jgi:hypothetical protein
MARGVRIGNRYENKAVELARELGYHVSSTRHYGGAGDQLWSARASAALRPLLVEVKATAVVPWAAGGDCFGPDRRTAMVVTGETYGFEPMLLWWVVIGKAMQTLWIPADEWPR